MKKTLSAVLGAILSVFVIPGWSAVVNNVSVPTVINVVFPCTGDSVSLTGTLHVLITNEVSTAGTTQSRIHFQPQQLSGVSANGVRYQATGITAQTVTSSSQSGEFTFVNNFRIIGQGPNNDLLAHTTSHVTIVDGDVTASVTNVSSSCGTGG